MFGKVAVSALGIIRKNVVVIGGRIVCNTGFDMSIGYANTRLVWMKRISKFRVSIYLGMEDTEAAVLGTLGMNKQCPLLQSGEVPM